MMSGEGSSVNVVMCVQICRHKQNGPRALLCGCAPHCFKREADWSAVSPIPASLQCARFLCVSVTPHFAAAHVLPGISHANNRSDTQ